MIRILPLLLLLTLCCAAPVAAEEILTALGDRWYLVQLPEPVVIPEAGVIGPVQICLDDVPGGLDGAPSMRVVPVAKRQGMKRTVTVTREQFHPPGPAGGMAYASYILQGLPGSAYWLGVVIRGKE